MYSTLTEALKVPGVWWVRHEDYDCDPFRFEVLEVRRGQSRVSYRQIGHEEIFIHMEDWDGWQAYRNFWLAWAAAQRSKRHG